MNVCESANEVDEWIRLIHVLVLSRAGRWKIYIEKPKCVAMIHAYLSAVQEWEFLISLCSDVMFPDGSCVCE